MPRILAAAVACAALLGLGGAGPACSPIFLELSPADGSTVATYTFEIEVEIDPGRVDPDTLEIRLNGVSFVPRHRDVEGRRFFVPLDAGPPLRDTNVLEASVRGNALFTRTHTFTYGPPKARARRIAGEGDRILGPVGQSRIGDWLLQNDVARFAVQDAPQRDLHSVGQFGGNLIDAELVARPGRDSFFELQPSSNIESVINAQTIQLVNDGEDGRPAVVRACGPDDLIDYVNPSSQISELGFDLPLGIDDVDHDLEGCTEYRLEPGRSYLEVVTTLFNLTDQELGLYVGDYINGMGAVEQWTPPSAGVGELQVATAEAQSYFGFGEAEGVDYALVAVPFEDPGEPTTSFTTSGVSFQLHGHSIPTILFLGEDAEPLFFVPPDGSRSFTRLFGVGDGSPSNAVALMHEASGEQTGTLRGCVTVGGVPAPSARVAVGPSGALGINNLASLFVTDAAGCYEGPLPPGDFSAAADRTGAPFEGGGATPPLHDVTIVAGATSVQHFALPASGRLEVVVADESGLPVPARVTVVGFDPSPDPGTAFGSSGLFRDQTRDPLPYGLATFAYTDPPGFAALDVEPGDYQVYVSRGTEYSLWSTPTTITAGDTAVLAAQVAPVLDTAGFVSSDYHVHLINSPDSRVSRVLRSLSFAGEGVDNLIATEHDALTDLGPTIRELGLSSFLHSTIGEEITSFDYGHFNAYPQALDPTRVSGGSTDWGRPAPPGEDFPHLGAFVRTPAEIEAEAVGKPQNAGLPTVVQVNHIGSHFGPLQIDTSQEPPQSFTADPTLFRLDPGTANFFHPFTALELWNGSSNGHQNEFLVGRIGVWMNLLNQGIETTAIADTDTHTFINLRTAGARTWTPSSSDFPGAIDDVEIGMAVAAGQAVGGQGLFVTATLSAASTGDVADHTLGGTTLAATTNGAATLTIDVQAPTWAPYDTIEVYRNASTTVVGTSGGVPVAFGAVPDDVEVGFPVNVVPVAAVPGGDRLETQLDVPYAGITEDTWFVVVVKGSPGTSPPMFPVFASSLDPAENPTLADLVDADPTESGVRALGFTNALYLDADGSPGFDPPGVQLAP